MSRLANRFVLEREIGSGGMSVVYLGRDEVLDRPVAVKILRSAHMGSDVGARFSREGRTAARISHPNVVQVYDAGEDVVEGREVSYIVMEHVSGGDLKDLIDEKGSIEERDLARVGAEVASGLAYAHELGVIHRDIKPHNILIDRYGRPKLTDFGIAKALDATQATQTGFYLGTALYSSPEQLRGEPATPKSDVYALGATLYHAALGATPFGGGPIEVASQQISRPVTPPRARGAEIGARLDRLIMRCLDKDPASRPEISDLQAELDAIRASASTSAPPAQHSELARPTSEHVLAAVASAVGNAARAAKNAGARGAARLGGTARELGGRLARVGETGEEGARRGGGRRTTTVPTRTFRSGYALETLVSSASIALVVLFLVVWAIVSILSGPETTQTAGTHNAQQGEEVAGRHPGPGGSGAGGAGSDKRGTNAAEGSDTSVAPEQSSGPLPPEGRAASVVYEMYLDSVGDDDYGASWNMLSGRLREEVGSQAQWKRRQSTLTSFSITGEELRTDRVEGGKAYVYGDVQINRTSGSRTLEGPWVLVAQDGQWKVDEIPDQ